LRRCGIQNVLKIAEDELSSFHGMKKKGRRIFPDMEESTRTGCVWTAIFTALIILAFGIFAYYTAPLK